MGLRLDLEADEVQLLMSLASSGYNALVKKIVAQANAQAKPPPAQPPEVTPNKLRPETVN